MTGKENARLQPGARTNYMLCDKHERDYTTRPKKIHRVLQALATGRSFNRLEAERQLADHCLYSTVSSIPQQYGIQVDRKRATVPGYQGAPTSVYRYWTGLDQRWKAREVLNGKAQR